MEEQKNSIQANHAPLSPLSFLYRTALVFGDRKSIIHGGRSFTWAQTLERCRRLASALTMLKISAGQMVSVVAPNIPAMYEMHFGIPMVGAVLNTINIRLDARTVSVMLAHAESKLLFVDTEFYPLVSQALDMLPTSNSGKKPQVVLINDRGDRSFQNMGVLEYEQLLQQASPDFPLGLPDEESCISLNYTSGTTSSPKGVLYTHRGAYLNTVASIMLFEMSSPVYLWTLPMFHCNGWCYTWGVAAAAGTNVCMRNVTASGIFQAIAEHKVTHLCGAPTVLNTIANAQPEEKQPLPHKVRVMAGGAAPPAPLLATMEKLGFDVSHGYGLTETYGPAVICEWKPQWDSLPLSERARLKARQGVCHLNLFEADVKEPSSMTSVPRDGKTIGEIMVRGSTVMRGYFKNEQATREAFQGGWFHTGDLGVMHSDGYLQVKDRSKDIIISGGENISSLEVESILYSHPEILEAAVVARPDDHWGETPCAFVTLKETSKGISGEEVIAFCRARMPRYMIPRTVVFDALPKTSTGKIQKAELKNRARAMGGRTSKL